ncbi:MAG: hypothetical protein ACRD1L_12830, partial [Terriglobales bacterium]
MISRYAVTRRWQRWLLGGLDLAGAGWGWLATFCLGRSRWSLGGRAAIPGEERPLALGASPSCRQWRRRRTRRHPLN